MLILKYNVVIMTSFFYHLIHFTSIVNQHPNEHVITAQNIQFITFIQKTL